MAVRIAGVNIPNDKRIEIALTYIHGIGRTRSVKILAEAKVDKDIRVKDLKEAEANILREIVEKNIRLKAICAARCKATSNVCGKSAAIAACAMASTCRFAASALRPIAGPSAAISA